METLLPAARSGGPSAKQEFPLLCGWVRRRTTAAPHPCVILTWGNRRGPTAQTHPGPALTLLGWSVRISSLFPPEERFVVALYDYSSVNDRDLQMLKGEKLQILKE